MEGLVEAVPKPGDYGTPKVGDPADGGTSSVARGETELYRRGGRRIWDMILIEI